MSRIEPPQSSESLTDPASLESKLKHIVETMREISAITDPQEMVRTYGERIRGLLPIDRRISLSRRGLKSPEFRVTRFSGWQEEINPWKQPDRLPLISGGLLAELIYSDEPALINNLQLAADDPAAEYLAGQRSLIAIPMFDAGEGLNMVILTREEANAFSAEDLPDIVWRSNLFGRATQNLVLAEQLKQAYKRIDEELQIVSEMQRSLLPESLPNIPQLQFSAFYQTARRAGGDYYDVFPLPNGCCGVLIADVSGHGTPAAVMMAVTHAIAHMYPGPPLPPAALLEFVNHQLTTRYMGDSGTFVTAFYGIIDAQRQRITYACAGHNPPRMRDGFTLATTLLDQASGLPLGILPDTTYPQATVDFEPTDQLLLYTDGITEAQDRNGELFGVERLDRVFGSCPCSADEIVKNIVDAVNRFTGQVEAGDDRTLVVVRSLLGPAASDLVRLD